MKLNFVQRIVIGIGILLILLSGLFLPYEGRHKSSKKYLGYHFAIPKAIAVLSAIDPTYANTIKSIAEESAVFGGYSAHIILSQVIIQMITITIVTIGLVFLLGCLSPPSTGSGGDTGLAFNLSVQNEGFSDPTFLTEFLNQMEERAAMKDLGVSLERFRHIISGMEASHRTAMEEALNRVLAAEEGAVAAYETGEEAGIEKGKQEIAAKTYASLAAAKAKYGENAINTFVTKRAWELANERGAAKKAGINLASLFKEKTSKEMAVGGKETPELTSEIQREIEFAIAGEMAFGRFNSTVFSMNLQEQFGDKVTGAQIADMQRVASTIIPDAIAQTYSPPHQWSDPSKKASRLVARAHRKFYRITARDVVSKYLEEKDSIKVTLIKYVQDQLGLTGREAADFAVEFAIRYVEKVEQAGEIIRQQSLKPKKDAIDKLVDAALKPGFTTEEGMRLLLKAYGIRTISHETRDKIMASAKKLRAIRDDAKKKYSPDFNPVLLPQYQEIIVEMKTMATKELTYSLNEMPWSIAISHILRVS